MHFITKYTFVHFRYPAGFAISESTRIYRICFLINELKYANMSMPLNLAYPENLPIAGFR